MKNERNLTFLFFFPGAEMARVWRRVNEWKYRRRQTVCTRWDWVA